MKAYNTADRQLHVLSQIIAKANRTFVPALEDDSHTNLSFDSLANRIIGRWIYSSNGSIILTLDLSSLDFEWLDASYNVLQSVPSVCKTITEIEQEISRGLLKLGLEPDGFSEKLHYDIPEYSLSKGLFPSIGIVEFNDWRYYRKLANVASALALEKMEAEGEVRIWPHHFDTGIYALANNGVGIGFGLAMEDSMVGTPYFYIAGYPNNGGSFDYGLLPDMETGRWIIGENWKGAVLPLSDLNPENEAEANKSLALFLDKSIHWYRTEVQPSS